jgi:hypothetical protein
MTVITQRQQQPQVVTIPNRRRRIQPTPTQKSSSGSVVAASLKASLVGGVCMLLLMLMSLIPLPFLACLVIPGFLVAWLSIGMLAGILAGDKVKSSYQGGKAGWMAGFWSGIYAGVIAMILAAFKISVFGIPIADFGQNVATQLELGNFDLIALAARVFGMFLMVGVIGSLVSGVFSSLGGMIYPKLSN